MQKIMINTSALRGWLKSNNLSQTEVSRSLGSDSIIANTLSRGWMSDTFFQLLTLKYNIAPALLELKSGPAKALSVGYSASIQVQPDKVLFAIDYNGEEIYHAYSKIKGDSELDLIQAISYAAHMCYKMAEQRELGGRK